MTTSLLDYENRSDRAMQIFDAKRRLQAKRPLSITEPIPGWRRFQNIVTGDTLDFDPSNREHAILLEFYEHRDGWREITPPPDTDDQEGSDDE